MATKKAPAKGGTVDRLDDRWGSAKGVTVVDKNGKPIGPNSAKKPTASKSKKK